MKANFPQASLALFFLIFLLPACQKKVQPTTTQDFMNETKEARDQRMAWWREARFGLFIHWGLYAVPAGEWNGKTEYGEWIRHTAEIPLETYDKFLGQFNPVKFNAEDWVRMAKDAGMKYIVITSKHHDGFSIFDSKTADFDVMATPFKRDILKELAEACKKEGIRLCFYHSIMDWRHPDYLPRRTWETNRSAEGADYQRYVSYMKSQLRELCTNYGEAPHVLWFDGEWENTWTHPQGVDLYNYVRSLKPDILINNRVDNGRDGMAGFNNSDGFAGDFGTPEQTIPATGFPGVDWESCMTMNANWGYNRADKAFKSTRELLHNLTDIASKGGNFLLNVGPTAEGLFPQESIDRLREMGAWMKINGESIHGTSASPFAKTTWNGRVSMKPGSDKTRLYLHVFERPADGKLTLHGCANEPVAAWLLADPSKAPLKIERKEDALVVTLPAQLPDAINSVVALDLKGKPDVHNSPTAQLTHDIFIGEIAVPLLDEAGNADIRYTLDGSVPTSKSTLYDKPILLKETATVTARSFRGEQGISGVFQKKLTKVQAQPATEVAATAPGLQYLFFEGEWQKLPDFSRMKPMKTGVLKSFDRPVRSATGEHFGYQYQGFIKISKDGVYTFFTSSDDGSRLWIDQKLVVDNDGLHGMGEKSGHVPLAAGLHEIWVQYFEATGGDDLQVKWQAEGGGKVAIPAEAMFHVQPK